MLKWFQSLIGRPSAPDVVEMVRIIGRLVEAHPAAIIDSSRLPASKLDIVRLLKAEWIAGNDPERRRLIELAWVMLPQFQDGVGEPPATSALPDGASPAEVTRILDRFLSWSKLMEAESELRAAELREFRSHPAP